MKKLILIFLLLSVGVNAQHWKTRYSQNFGNAGVTTGSTDTTPGTTISPATTDYTAITQYGSGTPQPPYGPADGMYAICNHSDNGYLYPCCWRRAGDHTTTDGTGRMMIVNMNPGKKGPSTGSVLEIKQTDGFVPGADYRFSFYGANLLLPAAQPVYSGTVQVNNKDGFLALGIYTGSNGTGTQLFNSQYQITNVNTAPYNTSTSMKWTQFTAAFTVPLATTAPQVYFNYYNWDPDTGGNPGGNDVAIDDMLIEEYVINVSGTVYYDPYFNNTSTSPYNGLGLLNVVFVDVNNVVHGVAPVQADGTYTLDNIAYTLSGDIGLKLILTSDNPTLGSTYNYASSIGFPGKLYPTEVITSATSPSGRIYAQSGYKNVIGFSNTTADITHADFGVTTADFGDAPDSYNTLIANNGASSAYRPNYLYLGSLYGYENDGSPSAAANLDTNDDGAVNVPDISIGATNYSLTVKAFNNSGSTKTLQGWFDFNRNGTFDTNEYVTTNVSSTGVSQNVTLNWTGLTGGVAGQTYLRLRLNDDTAAASSFNGRRGAGEVEDYTLNIYPLLDNDNDGITDNIDLDDDNDGILDENECLADFQNLSVASVQALPDTGATNSNFVTDLGLPVTVTTGQKHYDNYLFPTLFPANSIVFPGSNNLAGVTWLSSNVTFTFPYPVSRFKILAYDFDGIGLEYVSNFSITPTYLSSNLVNYNNTGVYHSTSGNQNVTLEFDPGYTFSSISFTVGRNTTAWSLAFLFSVDRCSLDTDGDGISNYLDLDSDNDGCPDAIEGGDNIINSQLVNSSINGGNTTATSGNYNLPVTTNLCATQYTGTPSTDCVGSTGVPTLVNQTTGQIVGSSTNNSILSNACKCFKTGANGTALDTNHGVTVLGRAGDDNGNWPMIRKGAWTALEAKSKGFVINRVHLTADLANITPAVEGMMVYDEEADCLKIYTKDDAPATSYSWRCFNNQTCPDIL